jgi:hypothetical protein
MNTKELKRVVWVVSYRIRTPFRYLVSCKHKNKSIEVSDCGYVTIFCKSNDCTSSYPLLEIRTNCKCETYGFEHPEYLLPEFISKRKARRIHAQLLTTKGDTNG